MLSLMPALDASCNPNSWLGRWLSSSQLALSTKKKCSGIRRETNARDLWQELRNVVHETAQAGSRGLDGGGEAGRVSVGGRGPGVKALMITQVRDE